MKIDNDLKFLGEAYAMVLNSSVVNEGFSYKNMSDDAVEKHHYAMFGTWKPAWRIREQSDEEEGDNEEYNRPQEGEVFKGKDGRKWVRYKKADGTLGVKPYGESDTKEKEGEVFKGRGGKSWIRYIKSDGTLGVKPYTDPKEQEEKRKWEELETLKYKPYNDAEECIKNGKDIPDSLLDDVLNDDKMFYAEKYNKIAKLGFLYIVKNKDIPEKMLNWIENNKNTSCYLLKFLVEGGYDIKNIKGYDKLIKCVARSGEASEVLAATLITHDKSGKDPEDIVPDILLHSITTGDPQYDDFDVESLRVFWHFLKGEGKKLPEIIIDAIIKRKWSTREKLETITSKSSEELPKKEVESPAIKKESEYQGTIGEKLSNIDVKISSLKTKEGQYGMMYIIKMVDDKGNDYVWFSSKDNGIAVGDSKKIVVGTVKDHNEFNGKKNTILTRIKFA